MDDPRKRLVLYDMESDPEERRNLAYESEYSDVVRGHEAAMDRFWAGLHKPLFELSKKDGKNRGWKDAE